MDFVDINGTGTQSETKRLRRPRKTYKFVGNGHGNKNLRTTQINKRINAQMRGRNLRECVRSEEEFMGD